MRATRPPANSRIPGVGLAVQHSAVRVRMVQGISGVGLGVRLRAKSAHGRHSRPDSGLEFQVKAQSCFKFFPSHSACEDSMSATRPPANSKIPGAAF